MSAPADESRRRVAAEDTESAAAAPPGGPTARPHRRPAGYVRADGGGGGDDGRRPAPPSADMVGTADDFSARPHGRNSVKGRVQVARPAAPLYDADAPAWISDGLRHAPGPKRIAAAEMAVDDALAAARRAEVDHAAARRAVDLAADGADAAALSAAQANVIAAVRRMAESVRRADAAERSAAAVRADVRRIDDEAAARRTAAVRARTCRALAAAAGRARALAAAVDQATAVADDQYARLARAYRRAAERAAAARTGRPPEPSGQTAADDAAGAGERMVAAFADHARRKRALEIAEATGGREGRARALAAGARAPPDPIDAARWAYGLRGTAHIAAADAARAARAAADDAAEAGHVVAAARLGSAADAAESAARAGGAAEQYGAKLTYRSSRRRRRATAAARAAASRARAEIAAASSAMARAEIAAAAAAARAIAAAVPMPPPAPNPPDLQDLCRRPRRPERNALGPWARAVDAWCVRIALGVRWIRADAERQEALRPRAVHANTRMSFRRAAAAERRAAQAVLFAAAAARADGPRGAVLYESVRAGWLRVAAALPPHVRARILSTVALPRRPVIMQGLVRRAADLSIEMYGGAAGACLPVSAALPPARSAAVRMATHEACFGRCVVPADGRRDFTAAESAHRHAACRAHGGIAAAAETTRIIDVGDRLAELGRHILSASGISAAYLRDGPLTRSLIADMGAVPYRGPADRAAVRPGAVRHAVDVIAVAVALNRPRDWSGCEDGDPGYEYASGTWADEAGTETVDLSATELYAQRMTDVAFPDQVPGCELPGCRRAALRTCGAVAILGHVGKGGKDDKHEGKIVAKRGDMSCGSRGCNMCHVKWRDAEAGKMADKLHAGVARARLADGGAPGRREYPVVHLAVSLPPIEELPWLSGPTERAQIRKAAIEKELAERCDYLYAWCAVDHTYRYEADLSGLKVSPHIHVLMIGYLNYNKNRDRFLSFRNEAYTTRRMVIGGEDVAQYRRTPVGAMIGPAQSRTIERVYGRCRGMFVKHLSTLRTHGDVRFVSAYILGHSTASARPLGELSGGEHTVRWYGALANGRTQVAPVSRYEAGDLIENSGAKLPSQITALTVWRSSASDRDDDTISRAETRHVWTGTGVEACTAGLHEAAAHERKDYPALAKNGGVAHAHDHVVILSNDDATSDRVVEEPGPQPKVETIEVSLPADHQPPNDVCLVLKVQGHSRPDAAAMCRDAVRDVDQAVDFMRADAMLSAAMRGDVRAAGAAGAAELAEAAAAVRSAAVLCEEAMSDNAAYGVYRMIVTAGARARDGARAAAAAAAYLPDGDQTAMVRGVVADLVQAARHVEAAARHVEAAGMHVGMPPAAAELGAASDRLDMSIKCRAGADRWRHVFGGDVAERLTAAVTGVDAMIAEVAAVAARVEDMDARRRANADSDHIAAAVKEVRAGVRIAAGKRDAAERAAAAAGPQGRTGSLLGARVAHVAALVRQAESAVRKACTLSKERSGWVVLRVDARIDHLCPLDGERICQVVWDPGGDPDGEPPVLPSAVVVGLGAGADGQAAAESESESESDDGATCDRWILTAAEGGYGEGRARVDYRWRPALEWMKDNRRPHLPAWDAETGEMIVEVGRHAPPPNMDAMPAATQRGIVWDMLYSHVRADLTAARERAGGSYRITRDMIIERTRALHSSAPVPAAASPAASA